MRKAKLMLAAVALCGTGLLTACGGNPQPTTTTTTTEETTQQPMPAATPAPLMPATPGTVRTETSHSETYPAQ